MVSSASLELRSNESLYENVKIFSSQTRVFVLGESLGWVGSTDVLLPLGSLYEFENGSEPVMFPSVLVLCSKVLKASFSILCEVELEFVSEGPDEGATEGSVEGRDEGVTEGIVDGIVDGSSVWGDGSLHSSPSASVQDMIR